jgi:hypothetical protein
VIDLMNKGEKYEKITECWGKNQVSLVIIA